LVPLAVNASSIETRTGVAEATGTSEHERKAEVIMAPKGKAGEGSRRIQANPGATSDAAKSEVQEEKGTESSAGTHGAVPVELWEGAKGTAVQPLEAQAAADDRAVEDPPAIENAVDEAEKRAERERGATLPDVNIPTPNNGRPEEPVAMNFEYANEAIFGDATQASGALNADEAPSTSPCDPCSDLITAAKRVIRDPKVSKNVGDLLLGVAKESWGSGSLVNAGKAALTSFAKAVAGRDAVQAKGEPCRGQLRLSFAFLDARSADGGISEAVEAFKEKLKDGSGAIGRQRDSKTQLLSQEILKSIQFQLLDEQLKIVGEGNRTYDVQGGVLISQVEAGTVYVSLLADIFGGAEIVDDFLATDPGGNTFTHFTRVRPTVGCPLTLTCPPGTAIADRPYRLPLVATGGMPPYTFSIIMDSKPEDLACAPGNGSITVTKKTPGKFQVKVKVVDSNTPVGTAMAPCDINCVECDDEDSFVLKEDASVPAPTSTGPKSMHGFSFRVASGLDTKGVLLLRPPVAQVRCFSLMEGDDSCGEGEQYISRVAISAIQGDELVACKQTGESGCSGFKLNPGMYTFSAPPEISIDSCNYMLASSSPISAYLGAGQGCSDIYFSYKKKGSEIQLISEISSPLGGNPYKAAKLDFPGMQYLMLREGDQTFAQQQTTTDGGAVYFRNLAAGTYNLFCQAPARYGSQPVTPVSPANGRMSLRVFAGQTSSVPVLVKFRTCTTAPAVLDGYVRDDTGQPVPQQLVQVLDNANRVVAAGLTDANGFYSIQIYTADNLTILVGTQQIAVSKSQVQIAMQAVGTPALPAPGSTLDLAVQMSELVREF
jgi:hypothetical protein